MGYYRQSLHQLGRTNAERITHHRQTGSYANPPPARWVPLAEVREEKVQEGWRRKEKEEPTPKEIAQRQKEHRTHVKRVYDTSQASQLWRRLDDPEPAPPTCPQNPEEGFGDDVIELAMRGMAVNRTAVDKTPAAAYMQWRSLVRLERKHNGPDADLESLTEEYKEAVRDYRERWLALQLAVQMSFVGKAVEDPEEEEKDGDSAA